jgi:hypothetical protein
LPLPTTLGFIYFFITISFVVSVIPDFFITVIPDLIGDLTFYNTVIPDSDRGSRLYVQIPASAGMTTGYCATVTVSPLLAFTVFVEPSAKVTATS